MKYIDEDLDFIFIRAKNKEGIWDSISIRDLSKKQWEEWLISKFGEGKRFWEVINNEVEQEEWTDKDKLDLINWLADSGAVFAMIKRGEARKN